MSLTLTTRNATLADLSALLREQQAVKLDVVAPAHTIRCSGGSLIIPGAGSAVPDPERGFTEGPGTFTPTALADGGIADRLGIPIRYLRKLREERIDLYDANVNGWLHGHQVPAPHAVGEPWEMQAEPDARSFLCRCFRGGDDDSGILRAFLSNGYGFFDHLDVLTATLEGIRDSGADTQIVSCDLSERFMRVRVAAPGVTALAPVLLGGGYRSPFDDPEIDAQRRHGRDEIATIRRLAAAEGHGYEPGTEPILFAGFEVSNSETGGGAASFVPIVTAEICGNGYRVTREVTRRVHLGSRMDDGMVRWSEDTQRKNLDLIVAQARDSVATFLSPEFVQQVVADLEEKAGVPVNRALETVTAVTKELGFSAERTDAILDHFIRGGRMTSGGVANAITSYAQTVADPDDAADVEATAIRAMELVGAVR